MALQLRVLVTFPKPAKQGQPAGWATAPAAGASVTVMQGRRSVFSGRADNTGYVGTALPPGAYVVRIAHGNIRHDENVRISTQRVRRTITIRSGAALLQPDRGSGSPIRVLPQRGQYQIVPGATRRVQ